MNDAPTSPARFGPMPDRRQLMLGGMVATAAAAATLLRPRRTVMTLPAGGFDSHVPLRIGAYRYASSTGLILPDRNQTGGIYDQVLTRVYVAARELPMMLLIAYGSGQDAGLALHRPEACYPSAGYAIGHRATVELRGVPGRQATMLTAARGDRVEQIYFWTRIGDRFPTSAMEQKWAVFAANVHGAMPDGALVRLSVRSADPVAALERMMAFNALLLNSPDRIGRALLLGGAA